MMQTEDSTLALPPSGVNTKACAYCKAIKSEDNFYKKGSRRDARCKDCTRSQKFVQYHNGQEKRRCTKDLEQHSKTYREEFGYPKLESHDGHPVVVDVICLPIVNTYVSANRVLGLYRMGASVDEIARLVARRPKFIKSALRKFGIGHTRGEKRPSKLSGMAAPYGWRTRDGRLVPHRGEQWILERIEAETKNGVDSDSIAATLNSARVKPRDVRRWIPQLVEHVSKENRKMKQTLQRHGSTITKT